MKKVWIIGAGTIAQEYAKVLQHLAVPFIVIGRGEKSAENFKQATGHDVITGGLEYFLSSNPEIAEKAIISTPVCELSKNTIALIRYGVKNILCEKPGFQYPSELKDVKDAADEMGCNVYYAYNRRFFASVLKAQEIIEEDGGVKSFNFEFTEWAHVIEKLDKSKSDLENWMYGNSTHVIDLAFYLGGFPTQMNCVTSGELSWHKPAIFAGSGVTDKGALFCYQANWTAPGRWGVEMLTAKHRLYLRPMEQLQIQNIGSVAVNPVEIDDSLDKEYKPGFYLETKKFIDDDFEGMCSLELQYKDLHSIYMRINGLL